MEKLFENKTTYTKETYMKFLRFHTKTYNLPYTLYTLSWAIVFILCIYAAFDSGNRMQGIIITMILIGFVAYRIYRPKRIVSKELESEKISNNNKNTFSFYNKNFSVKNNNGSFVFRYIMLRRIFETNEFFYLYIDKENAFILSKQSFTFGTAEDFSKFIKNKCKLRYKLKKG